MTDQTPPQDPQDGALRTSEATRDIDLVLITGAGASTKFGVRHGGPGRFTELPMMAEWSNKLVKKIDGGGPVDLNLIRLRQGLSGEEFEQTLGDFLRRVDAFREIEPLIGPSARLSDVPAAVRSEGTLAKWHSTTLTGLTEITKRIHESLFEEFAHEVTSPDAAAQAYGALLQNLGIDDRSILVYATTNYDMLGELALKYLGRRPDDGQLVELTGSASDPPLDVDNLLDGLPRYTPILHLHGRVGWYRRPGGVVYATNTSCHQDGFGTPIVMLPDPNKVYDGDDIINTLWHTFLAALERAKRVFVLGHSLNDTALVEALQQRVEPLSRIGVGLLADDNGGFDPSAGPLLEKVREVLPQAGIIPVRFEEAPVIGEQLSQWLERQ